MTEKKEKSVEQIIEEDLSEGLDGVNDTEETEETVEDERETVEVYLEDLETLAETLAEYEADEGIEDKIERALVDERVIYLQGEVGTEMTNSIIPLIQYYNIQDDKDKLDTESRTPIKIYVDSEGGEVYKGLSLLSQIENSKTPVYTYLEGSIGMSMGLVLFLAGHKRYASRFGHLLYHELRAGSETKTLAEMQNTINHYVKLQNKLDSYIVERTSIPMKKLKNYRKRNMDWYIDFEEAKKYNVFTDEI